MEISRRSLAKAVGATAAGAAAIMSLPIATALGASSDEADRLYRRYVSMIPEKRRLDAAYDEAEQQMPEWARPGPEFITKDGTFKGDTTGWPRDVSIKPAPYLDKVCRPSPDYLRRQYETFTTNWYAATYLRGQVTEADALRWYRKELRALVQRRRAKEAEEDRVGLAAKDAALQRQFDLMFDIKADIERLPPSMNSVAALALLEAKFKGADSYVTDMEDFHFDHMRPQLSGLIAEHVTNLLAAMSEDPLPRLRDMPFYG